MDINLSEKEREPLVEKVWDECQKIYDLDYKANRGLPLFDLPWEHCTTCGAILKKEDPEAELVMSSQPTYYLGYDDEKWPFATSKDGVTDFLRDVVSVHLVFDDDPELPFQTMTTLLANEKVNEKYALGKVQQKLLLQQYLPF